MAHVYDLKGGILEVTKFSGETAVYLSFYVFDHKSTMTAYCWYGSALPAGAAEKLAELESQNRVHRHRAGIGGHGLASLTKPLDLRSLNTQKCELSLATQTDSTMKGTATLLLDKGPVTLSFPITADFGYGFPTKTRGMITDVEIAKTKVPTFPKKFLELTES